MSGSSLIGFLRRGVRIGPYRSARRLYVSWLPVVLDFGYLRYNPWWWHNLHATFAWVYRLHYGRWPTYHEWDREHRSRVRAERKTRLERLRREQVAGWRKG